MAGTVRESKTILTAEDKTGGAFASLQKKLDETTAKLTDFSAHWKAIAGGLTAGAFATMIKNSIDAMTAMKDLATEAGVTASALSRFEEPAKLAGMTLGDLTGAIQKMSKSLIAAKDPASGAAQALGAFGLSMKDLVGLSPDKAFEKIAKASTLYGNSIEKNAALMELFGKSGAQLQKVFQEIADKGELVTTLTDEQAEAADKLGDSIDKLHLRSEAWRRSVASELIPSLQKAVDVFTEMTAKKNEAGGFFEFIGGVVRLATLIVGGFVLTIKDLGDQIGFLAAKAAALTTIKVERAADGGITGFQLGDKTALKELDDKRAATFAAYEAALKKLHDQMKTGKADVAEEADNWDRMGKAVAKFNPELSKADDEYKKLLITINEKIKSAEQEAGIGRKLSDGEKLLFEILNNKYEKLLPWQKEAAANKARELIVDEKLVALRKADLELLKADIDAEQQITNAMAAQKRAADDLIGTYAQRNKDLEFEMTLIGKSADEVDRLRIAEQTRRDALKATDETQRKLIEQQGELYLNNVQSLQTMKAQAGVWDDLSARAGNFFGDLAMNGKSAFDSLKNSLKSFVQQLISLFAQKWILNVVGQGSLAGSVGAGTTAGTLLSGGGLLANLGGMASGAAGAIGLPGVGNFIGGMTGAIAGPALPGSALAMGQGAAGMLSTAAPYLAAIAAAYALIKKFGDKGENPKAMLGFGSGAQAYTTSGVFGAEGFKSIQTDDAFNKSLQAYFASFKAMDEGLAKLLTDSQKQRISSALGSASQYEFAFPKGDGTAGEQLSVAYLKSKYGVVFEELDKTFADFVKNFTGKAEDLQKAIADESTVLAMLGDASAEILGKIPGLTIDGLRDMERAGESLADTFQRVVGDFLAAENALNSAIASRNPAFARDLVLGQRNSIGAQFGALIGQQYGAGLATQMATNPQSFTGLGTEGMSLLAQWLGLQTTLEQLDAQLANTTTPAINDFTAAVVNSASAMSSAIGGLASYLRGSLLGDLSPLSPQARYAEAKKQFNDNLTLAQGGNIDAISSFGSYRDQFLSASRAVNASSGQYNTDFFGSFNAGAALTGGAVRPYTAADANVNTSAIVAAIAATASGQQVTNTILVDYLNELAQGNTSQNSSKIVELLGMLNDRVRINGGALTSNSGALA